MLLIIFLFYKQMEEPIYGSSDALNSLKGERFSGRMTIFLFIQVGFIVLERYLFLMNPAEWTDWETFKKAKAEYGNPKHIIIKRITRNLTSHTPIQKFVSVAKRIKFLLSFFNVTADKFTDLIKETYKESEQTTTDEHIRQQDYIHNPLFKRLK